jgi:hypothetical protein
MKILKLLFLLLFFATQLAAQSNNQRFEGGLVAGINLSQIDGDLLDGFNQPGFHAGAKVNAIITERWRAGIELLYAQQGASRHRLDNPVAAYEKIRINTVEVPVLAHFRDWKIDATAGFSYSRVINYEIIDVTGEDVSDQIPFSPNIYSVVLGVSFRLNEDWAIEFRWSRWMNNIREDDIVMIPGGEGKFFGRNLTFRGAYTF